MTERVEWNEAREMDIYRPGQKVEIKSHPEAVDTIIAYDPMMVPPITLALDPQPRYPEELILLSQPAAALDWLKPLSRLIPSHSNPSTRKLVSSR